METRKPRDRFYDYLQYQKEHGPISPGDYLDELGIKEILAWTQLTTDCIDTWKAGNLTRVITDNGGAAYLPPNDVKQNSNERETHHEYV